MGEVNQDPPHLSLYFRRRKNGRAKMGRRGFSPYLAPGFSYVSCESIIYRYPVVGLFSGSIGSLWLVTPKLGTAALTMLISVPKLGIVSGSELSINRSLSYEQKGD